MFCVNPIILPSKPRIWGLVHRYIMLNPRIFGPISRSQKWLVANSHATAMGLGQRPQFSALAKPSVWKCVAKTPEKCHSSWELQSPLFQSVSWLSLRDPPFRNGPPLIPSMSCLFLGCGQVRAPERLYPRKSARTGGARGVIIRMA